MPFSDLFTPVQQQITELTSSAAGPIAAMSFFDRSHLMVELSILAYFDLPGATQWGSKMGFTRTTQQHVDGDLSVTIFSNDTDIVISFRGTYNIPNAVQDVDFQLIPDGVLPGKAHQGFLRDFNKCWSTVTPVLTTKKKLWSTGHSLGGAMAAIAAVRAARRDGPCVDGLTTFGQPRIGNIIYVNGLKTDTHRYVNNMDIVPRLPTPGMGYSHFGKEHYINSDGSITPTPVKTKVARMFDRIGDLLQHGLGDHNIINYRAAILCDNQESANGKR